MTELGELFRVRVIGGLPDDRLLALPARVKHAVGCPFDPVDHRADPCGALVKGSVLVTGLGQ